MNILFLNEYAPPHYVSGAEYSMMALLTALNDSKKAKVYLLSANLGGQSKYLRFPFIKKIKPGNILAPTWFNNPFFWLYAACQIKSTINRYKIDLLHVHGKYIQPAAIIAGWLTGTPVITTVRDFKFLCPLALCFTNQQKQCSFSYYLKKEIIQFQKYYHQTLKLKLILAKLWQYLLKWFLNQSAIVVAVSPQLATIYQTAGINHIIPIYNLPPQKKAKKKKSLTKTIISVGKLSYGKGTDSLLQAAAQLPKFKFILAGRKNPSLKAKFPHNVKYLGKLPHQQISKLYQQADVFIINSRWPEPLSRAGLEALAFGLPIIASARGGNRELINHNGFLVDPDKPAEIASAIKKIFKLDINQLSQNSHQLLLTRFSRKKIIHQHLQLYQKFL